jgi:hypothetical protein
MQLVSRADATVKIRLIRIQLTVVVSLRFTMGWQLPLGFGIS